MTEDSIEFKVGLGVEIPLPQDLLSFISPLTVRYGGMPSERTFSVVVVERGLLGWSPHSYNLYSFTPFSKPVSTLNIADRYLLEVQIATPELLGGKVSILNEGRKVFGFYLNP